MTSIQVILIVLSLLAAVWASFVFQSQLASRLLVAFFFVTATFFVLFPNGTTRIAHALGVGRGADLLLYLALFAGIHAFLLLYLRTRRLERRVTELIRTMAIIKAEEIGSVDLPSGAVKGTARVRETPEE
jgi:small membrane protein